MKELVVGINEYVDPIYHLTGILSEYSDVICSREENLLNSGVIRTDMRPGQILDLALGCCEERTEDRPKMILVAKEIKLSKHH
ncbi:unnamed protein product [Brassica oleracea var. botrytis]|uniref:(rape) hypothetical protein n=1 Tax=Brassica napus TaxID=3708 RepID=A0A816JYE0_BRANA|nr:unnamed protein product [Brassica napus]